MKKKDIEQLTFLVKSEIKAQQGGKLSTFLHQEFWDYLNNKIEGFIIDKT